jgi:CRP/FNR family transcriptional regulator
MLLSEKLRFFQSLSLFSSLTPSELEALQSMSSERRFEKGLFLFQEGDPAKGILIIKQGYVKVVKQAATGKNIVIRLVFPNEIMGEVAMFSNKSYPVSAQALVDTVVYEISRENMLSFTIKYPDIVLKLIGVCVGRLVEAYSTIDGLGTKGLEERIAITLLQLAKNVGKNNETDIILDISLSRQDLAEMVGGTQESVCRIMANLKREGIIKSLSRKIIISDLEGLKLMAEVGDP